MDGPRSILLEFQPSADTVIPTTTGHLGHGLFLRLVKQFDPDLNSWLHNGPSPRPFTLSSLSGGQVHRERCILRRNVPCHLRLTLLDGGYLWERLKVHFLESGPIMCRFGSAELHFTRMVSTPSPSVPHLVGATDWQTLAAPLPQRLVTFQFVSPTAFSQGKRQFALFPKPLRIWESLIRVWNRFAPEHFHLDKNSMRQSLSNQEVVVVRCDLQTQTLHFPDYFQKGFTGTCTYLIRGADAIAAELTALAALAPYAGIGYKTTMGMGQVRIEFHEETHDTPFLFRHRESEAV